LYQGAEVKADLLIRGATVVTSASATIADVAVNHGRIAAIAPSLDAEAERVIQASGDYLLPGFIDAHVHFNEPGRTEWEGVATGSRALAAGGGTLFIDMPLNSDPPVLDAATFAAKAAAIAERSVLDAAIWGGLVPTNHAQLKELADCGVIGFKAFMSASGIDEFPCTHGKPLLEGMKRAADLRLPVAVHAESNELTGALTQRAIAEGRTAVEDYLATRPVEAELEAIEEVLLYARQTGCAIHVVHVSSRAGLDLIAAAKKQGVDVTAETCPHYLVLTDLDMVSLGAVAKCAPPLRPRGEVARLRQALGEGLVDTIGSDHSPAPPDMKRDANFFKVWGGISGCQHALPLLFELALEEKIELSTIARMTATNVARRFRLAGKGDLVVGGDADMVLISPAQMVAVDLRATGSATTATSSAPRQSTPAAPGGLPTIRAEDLLYRHRQSPYVGRTMRVAVRETFARGESIWPKTSNAPRHPAQILRPSSS
jgi:allantoinase